MNFGFNPDLPDTGPLPWNEGLNEELNLQQYIEQKIEQIILDAIKAEWKKVYNEYLKQKI